MPTRQPAEGHEPKRGRRPWWRWLFEDRTTGRLNLASWPNVPLWIWIAARSAQKVLSPSGSVDHLLGVVGSIALLWWAVLELWSGVNPWRRLLGFAVLLWVAASALT